MSDRRLPELSELRVLPALAVLPGQVEEALTLVHRRRRRSAATAASAVMAAVTAAAVISVVRPGDSVSLQPARPDAFTATASPAAPHEAAVVDAPARPGHRPAPVTATPAAPATTDRAQPSATPTIAPTAPPSVGGGKPVPRFRPRPELDRKGPYLEDTSESASHHVGRTTSCTQADVEDDWCYGMRKSENFDARNAWVKLTHDGCRRATQADIRYSTEQQAEFVVETASGVEVWRWSSGQTFAPKSHVFSVPARYCASWSITWDMVLDDGRLLPAGDYTVTARSTSDYGLPEMRIPWTVQW